MVFYYICVCVCVCVCVLLGSKELGINVLELQCVMLANQDKNV